jgi:Carboxypeptidase regulatory-like domain
VLGQAKITAINNDTGGQYATQTNQTGVYVLPSLPPGEYRIQVEKTGFRTIVKPEVLLHLQDRVELNFEMAIGSASEVVTVSAGASLINTTDGSVSTVVDQTYVANMPLNGRSFQDLILLTPGVVTQTPQNLQAQRGVTGEFSVNGQRAEENYYTVDGVNANTGAVAGLNMTTGGGASGSLPGSTALGTTQALVSVDELQEFRVQSSTYSAEYGRNPGGQFAFETKSGTNQWHGSAYDYVRNSFFDARDWFNDFFNVKEPPLRQNDFGGTLGGPVRIPRLYNGKDKTFFFVNYEGLRLAAPEPAAIVYVPDDALRSSAPTPLQQVLNAFPTANGSDLGNGLGEYIASWTNADSINSTSVRFDHLIKEKNRLFFRFSNTASVARTRQINGPGFNSPTVKDAAAYTARTYTAGATSLLTSHLSNDLRLNYTSNETTERAVLDSFGGGVPLDLSQLAGLSNQAAVTVNLFFGGFTAAPLFQDRQAGSQRAWNLVDTISLSLGRHQLKFGVDYRRASPFFVPFNPSVGYSYFSQSDIQNNNASVFVQANAQGYPLYTNFSAFVEDEWKASRRLNLSMGLRWEVNPSPGVTHGQLPYTVAFTPDPNTWALAPLGTPLWKTTWLNFAPRLGAAYTIRDQQDWITVVRAGGGVFFDTGQQLGSLGMAGAPGFFAFGASSGSFSGPVSIPVVNPPQSPFFGPVSTFHPHLQLPYTLQWNASVEQALGKSQTLTLSYVGSHGARLLKEDVFLPFGNPFATLFFVVGNGLTSDYGSSQVQYMRRLSHGLAALASYTWSHCIDYDSQNYLFGYQRGNCDFDLRHNFSSALSYDVPDVGHSTLANSLLHHWGFDNRLTARTGFPITLQGNFNIDPNTGKNLFSGVDVVPGQPIYVTQCQDPRTATAALIPCPGGRGVNPNAFTIPPIDPNTGNTTRAGNAPRNFVRGFGAWQMDLAVRREFPIYERLKLQFRAEAFNIFNHPNFGFVGSELGSNRFGEAEQTLANSLGTLSPIYQMGGPRSMQFALKAIF